MKQKCTSGAMFTHLGMNRVSCDKLRTSKIRHYFGVMLLLFTLLGFSNVINAQLSDGAIVTIASGSTYLAASGNRVTNSTTITTNSLLYVTGRSSSVWAF